MTKLPDLPLLHEGDSFLIELEGGDKVVRILRLMIFPGNINGVPKVEVFGDLDVRARRAVINQINRRYPGKLVHV